jgi:hypothetical protein
MQNRVTDIQRYQQCPEKNQTDKQTDGMTIISRNLHMTFHDWRHWQRLINMILMSHNGKIVLNVLVREHP